MPNKNNLWPTIKNNPPNQQQQLRAATKHMTPEYKNQDTLATSGSDTGSSKEATAGVDPLSQEDQVTTPATDDHQESTQKSTLVEYLEQDSRHYPTEKLAALLSSRTGYCWKVCV
jgi:hypothetical protein